MQAGWMLEEDLIIVLGSPSQSKLSQQWMAVKALARGSARY
jgi:hypothetical protein